MAEAGKAIRLAVLGLGSIGMRHARNARALGATVVGYDPNSERCAAFEEFGRSATTREDALADVQAAVIASPSRCHLDDLGAAIDAGCHVFVEKPMAHRLDGLEAMLDAADASGTIVFVGQNLRVNPSVNALKGMLDEGAVGKPLWAQFLGSSYLPEWRPEEDYRTGYASDPESGGAVFDFIHEFDLAAYLLGPYEIVAMAAQNTGTLDIEAEDCAVSILRHRSGILSTIHVDFATRPWKRVAEIGGTKGRAHLDVMSRRSWLIGNDGTLVAEHAAGGVHDDDYFTEMEAFLNCIDGSARPVCDGREALGVLTQVLDARRAAGLAQA